MDEKQKWEPFRVLLLSSIVRHLDELLAIGKRYSEVLGPQFKSIKDSGVLDAESLSRLEKSVAQISESLGRSKQEFFFAIQTAAPSLKPEAAEYCSEAFYFGHTLEGHLQRASELTSMLSSLPELTVDNVERPLSELRVIGTMIELLLGMRFSKAKTNFVHYVWKQEQLHYSERDRSFLSPRDYKMTLDAEKSATELKAMPRTTPIKRFFDPE